MSILSNYLIYVVEDDEDDRFLLQRAITRQSVACSLRFFTHGADLFTQLTHQLDGRLPDLIILDLNTPIMNGFESLQLLKQLPDYQHIPVLVRTGHETLESINRCYELGCHAYLTKKDFTLPLAQMASMRLQ